MPLDLPPHHDAGGLWLPPKPAIIRPADHSILRPGYFRPVDRAERRAIIAELVRARRLTPEEARRASLLVPVVGWQAGAPPVCTYINRYINTSGADTFSGVSIGTASSDRLVVIVVSSTAVGSNNATLSSATILGNSATVVVQGSAASSQTAIIQALITSGTSGTVSCTWSSGSRNRGEISVYTVTGWKSSTATNAAASAPDTGTTPIVVSVNCLAGGCVIAGADGDQTHTWTGVTKDWEANIAGPIYGSSGHASNVAAATPRTVSLTFGSTADEHSAAAVSYR